MRGSRGACTRAGKPASYTHLHAQVLSFGVVQANGGGDVGGVGGRSMTSSY